jgi:hypothetical protein
MKKNKLNGLSGRMQTRVRVTKEVPVGKTMWIYGILFFLAYAVAGPLSANPRDNACPPGMNWSREVVNCIQTTCPPGSGRVYTLECHCGTGVAEHYQDYTNPNDGSKYHLLAYCGSGGISGWWSRQSTLAKTGLVVGGIGILAGLAVAGGLITWAGLSALAGGAAAGVGAVYAYAGELVTAWLGEKGLAEIAKRMALQAGKYLFKKLGRKATRDEVMALMLQQINAQLLKRGLAAWAMPQLETLLFGIDLLW